MSVAQMTDLVERVETAVENLGSRQDDLRRHLANMGVPCVGLAYPDIQALRAQRGYVPTPREETPPMNRGRLERIRRDAKELIDRYMRSNPYKHDGYAADRGMMVNASHDPTRNVFLELFDRMRDPSTTDVQTVEAQIEYFLALLLSTACMTFDNAIYTGQNMGRTDSEFQFRTQLTYTAGHNLQATINAVLEIQAYVEYLQGQRLRQPRARQR